jgi:hypothetical protein
VALSSFGSYETLLQLRELFISESTLVVQLSELLQLSKGARRPTLRCRSALFDVVRGRACFSMFMSPVGFVAAFNQ